MEIHVLHPQGMSIRAIARHLSCSRETVRRYIRSSLASGVPRSQIQELAGVAFIERQENVVMLGPSGVGKTHLATAIGYKAAMAGTSIRFFTAADMMLQLLASHRQEDLKGYLTRAIGKPKLLIIDDHAHIAQISGQRYRLEDKLKSGQIQKKLKAEVLE